MDRVRLKPGTTVMFSNKSGNDRIDPSVHEVESFEEHNGRTFYRLKGIQGALFVRENLATAEGLHVVRRISVC